MRVRSVDKLIITQKVSFSSVATLKYVFFFLNLENIDKILCLEYKRECIFTLHFAGCAGSILAYLSIWCVRKATRREFDLNGLG